MRRSPHALQKPGANEAAVSRKGRKKTPTEILSRFSSKREVNHWLSSMETHRGKQLFQGWNIRDETNFIRCLRDSSAFDGIISFTKHHSSHSLHMYNTAIFCLSFSSKHRAEALELFDDLEGRGLEPTAYTLSAVFRVVDGPYAAREMRKRIKDRYSSLEWTIPVWEAAVYACSRDSTNGWSVADEFVSSLKEDGHRMTARLYLALFAVCKNAGDVPHTMDLLDTIRREDMDIMMNSRLWGASLQVCAKAGEPGVAMLVLETMQEEGHHINVYHCTSFLKAASVAGFDKPAFDFLNHMAGIATPGYDCELVVPPPDRVAVQTALDACRLTGNFAIARSILDSLKNHAYGDHIKLSTFDYNAALAACRVPQEAKELIREMRLSRRYRTGVVPPNSLSYTRALTVCQYAGDPATAKALLKSAIHDDVIPDLFMYNTAIKSAATAKDVEAAYRFLREIRRLGFVPNTMTYNGMLAALASTKKIGKSIQFLRSLKSERLFTTSSTYKYLGKSIRGIKDMEEKATALEEIYSLLEDREKRTTISGPILAALINVYGCLDRYDDARAVYRSIRGATDISCLRAMLFACSYVKPSRWEDALMLLHTSDILGVSGLVDSGALSNAMLACSKAHRWKESLNLWRLYGNNNTSILSMNSLIAACGRDGRPDKALEVLNEMVIRGPSPDLRSYRNAMIACSNGVDGDDSQDEFEFTWWECALSLLRRMKEQGLLPDCQTYSAAISTFEKAGKWQYALSTLQQMVDQDLENGSSNLNVYCFNAALSACAKGGAWVEALDLFERMKDFGGTLEPNFITVASVVLALDYAGQKEVARDIYQEGVQSGAVVSPWRYTIGAKGGDLLAMDLHRYSGAMARAAVRCHMEKLLSSKEDIKDDWIVIVGKGLRSSDQPVLSSTVHDLFQNDYSFEPEVDPVNAGRIIVPRSTLHHFVCEHRWV